VRGTKTGEGEIVTASETRIASISGLRGVVGAGLDPVIAGEFAAAYASECEPGPIVLGHDGRVSAPVFSLAVQAAIMATGHEVLWAGAAATPTIGLLARDLGSAGGIQISASHNPPEYNGLKFFQRGGMVYSAAQGKALLERWARREFRWARWHALGRMRSLDEPDSCHLTRVLACVDVAAIRRAGFTVALDACHGAGGRMGAELLRELGCHAIVLGGQPDGAYDHEPEPTENNLREFAAIVPAVGASVGFAQDPDADRLAIIDEAGRYIGEELTLALAALRRFDQARGPLVLNLSSSRVTEDLARRHGCPVLRTPVGEINVVECMISENALLGGEGNGGVIDPRVGFVRDSFVAMALVLDLLAHRGQSLSSLVAQLPRYAMLKLRYPLKSHGAGRDGPAGRSNQDSLPQIWSALASAHPEARLDQRDGVRLDWEDRWVHIRPSNTEPIVRVIAEAPELAAAHDLAARIGTWLTDAQGQEGLQ
jgi:phosphomannomutase